MKNIKKNLLKYLSGLSILIIFATILTACSSNNAANQTSTTPIILAPLPSPSPTQTQTTLPSETPSNTPNTFRGMGQSGSITGINGNILTLNTAQGQVTVNISSNTSIQKSTTASIDDLQKGQFLTVSGTADSSGNVAASSITLTAQGQVSSFTPSRGGSSNSTRRFSGSNNSSGTNPGFNGPGNRVFGTITDINGDTLTLSTAQGQQTTVTINTDTKIQKIVSGTSSDLQTGETVTAIGPKDSNGDINAVSIMINQ